MKLCFITTLLFLLTGVSSAQNSKLDSLTSERASHKVDSIQSSFYQESDSLKSAYKSRFQKLDSVQAALKNKLDSLTTFPGSAKNAIPTSKIDSIQSKIKSKVDSLTSFKLPNTKITRALDSINTLRDSTLASFNKKLQSIKDNTIGKLNNSNLPPELNDKVSQATANINDFKIPGTDLNLPALNSGDHTFGELNNLNLQSPVPDVGKVGGVGSVKGEVAGISSVTGKVGEYGSDIKKLTTGDLSEVKELPTMAEAKAEELSGVGDMKEQTQVLDEYKGIGEKMQNPDSLKEFAVQEVKQYAVNHFAGKEEQLKQAMETLAKYKTKYASVNSISDITKRPPNEMRGKPFIERFIPGIALQVQKKGEDFMVDFNPYAGYRFTGRLMAGLGWNQRFAYNTKNNYFNSQARIFGPRAFGEFKLWKGFSPRAELEVMNTNVPPLTRTPSLDPGSRQWVWGAFVGMKKEYRFIKNVKGTALVMVRLYNPDHKSPYADVLNVRFGFEFPMKKKVKANGVSKQP